MTECKQECAGFRALFLLSRPHCPNGSSDKLYEIKPDLTQVVRAEFVGGTAAQAYWLWRDWTKKGRVQGADSE